MAIDMCWILLLGAFLDTKSLAKWIGILVFGINCRLEWVFECTPFPSILANPCYSRPLHSWGKTRGSRAPPCFRCTFPPFALPTRRETSQPPAAAIPHPIRTAQSSSHDYSSPPCCRSIAEPRHRRCECTKFRRGYPPWQIMLLSRGRRITLRRRLH